MNGDGAPDATMEPGVLELRKKAGPELATTISPEVLPYELTRLRVEALKPILKELVQEELKHVQEVYMKRIEGLIKEVMDQRIRNMISSEVLEFRRVPKEEAKLIIKNYVMEHPGCLTSEIIQNLRLDPELVAEILEELDREGEIKGEHVTE